MLFTAPEGLTPASSVRGRRLGNLEAMMLSDEMREHAENEDFTSIKAVYHWASRVAKLERVATVARLLVVSLEDQELSHNFPWSGKNLIEALKELDA